jgi:hypothetical protein
MLVMVSKVLQTVLGAVVRLDCRFRCGLGSVARRIREEMVESVRAMNAGREGGVATA